MAFPIVEGSASQSFSGGVAARAVPLPASIVAGELLVVWFVTDRQPSLAIPAGWTRVASPAEDWSPGDLSRGCVIYRVATGSEGSTITITQGAVDEAVSYAWRISNYDLPLYLSRAGSGADGSPNPPLWDSWDSNDSLWFALMGNGEARTATAYPGTYDDDQATRSAGTAGTGCGAAVCSRSVRAQTQNPGTFTLNVIAPWIAATLLIRSPD